MRRLLVLGFSVGAVVGCGAIAPFEEAPTWEQDGAPSPSGGTSRGAPSSIPIR